MATSSGGESNIILSNNNQGNRESIEGIENVLHTLSNILSTSGARDLSGPVATTSKSSTEILSELFSSFNAEPPNLPETFQDSNVSTTTGRIMTDSHEGSSDDDTTKKSRSNKKKHKHKSKKHKKKSKREKSSKSFSHTSETKCQHVPVGGGSLQISADVNAIDTTFVIANPKQTNIGHPTDLETSINCKQLSTDQENAKSSTGIGKISIKNLKFSSVFEATLREVEQQAKEKADKYEEGEISNSSRGTTPRRSSESDEEHGLDVTQSSDVVIDRVRSKRHRSSKYSERKSRSEHQSVKRFKESRDDSRTSANDSHHTPSKISSRCDKHSDVYVSDQVDRRDSKDGDCHKRRTDNKYRKSKDHASCEKSRDRERCSISRDKDRHGRKQESHSRDRSSDREKQRKDGRHSSSSRSRDHHSKRRGRSHSESPSFDKQKLMEIARKNALSLLKHGALPGALGQDKMVSIKAGGKSVEELTNFCKRLSKKETGKSDSEVEGEENSDSETERPFNHPFQIKERPMSIVMNIRNSTQLPVKSLQEKTAEQSKILRVQFPVSSGQQHRKTESEWVPVEPKPPISKELQVPVVNETIATPPPQGQVFPTPPSGPVKDIGNIVTQRLRAMRKLQENPHDIQALTAMYSANQDMQNWAESKQLPGQFTGSTGVRVLSVAELSSGTQAYAKKNQLVSATPVSGGMGMSLLQKMGWRPGEGLGKNKGGSLEPLSLEIKMDKRGLVTQEDLKQNTNQAIKRPVVKNLNDKHPISVLIEFCARRRYKTPVFEMSHESGPDHKKNFLFKVQVNGVDYQPVVTSSTKKLAKADAASVCLRALGVLGC